MLILKLISQARSWSGNRLHSGGEQAGENRTLPENMSSFESDRPRVGQSQWLGLAEGTKSGQGIRAAG